VQFRGHVAHHGLRRVATRRRCDGTGEVQVVADDPHLEVERGHAVIVRERVAQSCHQVLRRLAHDGDTVLLAPAAASKDMYVSYAHRGDAFAAAVEALR